MRAPSTSSMPLITRPCAHGLLAVVISAWRMPDLKETVHAHEVQLAVGPVLRPNAQREWRPRILGLAPDANEKEAEERAVTWARRNLIWTAALPRGLSYAAEGAVCEAACMAVLGWREADNAAGAGQLPLRAVG